MKTSNKVIGVVVAGAVAITAVVTNLPHNAQKVTSASPDLIFRNGVDGPMSCDYGPPTLHRITNTSVTYISAGYAVAGGVDVTQYQNVWGRYSPTDTILPWPDQSNVLVYITLGRGQFWATKFTVPDPYANPHTSGRMARGEVVQIGDVSRTSASISETCGDFSVDIAAPACVIDSGYIGSPLLQWSINGFIPGTCPLVPGHTYYYNFMMSPLAHPDAQHSYCDHSSCVMTTVPYYVN